MSLRTQRTRAVSAEGRGPGRPHLAQPRPHDEVTGQNLKLPTPTAPRMGDPTERPTERPQPCRQHSPLEPSAP